MEYLVEKLPILLPILFYLLFFLPTLVLSILCVIIFLLLPSVLLFGSLAIKLLFRELKNSEPSDSKSKTVGEKSERIGYKYGCFLRRLHSDLTENFPISLLRKTVVIPIQNKIVDFSSKYFMNLLKKYFARLKQNNSIYECKSIDNSIYYKIFFPFVFLIKLIYEQIIGIYFAAISSWPILILVIIIYLV